MGKPDSGKAFYIPRDLQSMNLEDSTSQWSYHRMAYTDNFVILWEKGFGSDLANPPMLEGKPMSVDLVNLSNKLEEFYQYFRDTLQFVKTGTKADKYRMIVMINYSLEGTAYGGDYDGEIGALWVAPNRIQDEKLNCIAHELGHSFQAQISCDGEGEAWGGCGFFEMTSQWMLWQVNPEWITDEEYHWNAFMKSTHKAYLHLENIYRSPYVLEYWSVKHGLPFIAELFREGRVGEDPVMTYKRMTGLSQSEFCDEMFDVYRHLINWDFDRVWSETRQYANRYTTKFEKDSDPGWYRIVVDNCPENYGFNAVALTVPQKGETLSVEFVGESELKNFTSVNPDKAGWRYGFVAITEEGKSIYGDMKADKVGQIGYTIPDNVKLSHLWFVVMGAPTEHWMNPAPSTSQRDAQWPYRIKISGGDLLEK